MDYQKRTQIFTELYSLDAETLRDLYIKYGLMADALIGSSDSELLENNISTYKVLLSPILIDFVTYQFISGDSILNSVKLQYPNLSKMLGMGTDNKMSLSDIYNKYKKEGWDITDNISISNLKTALSEFGLTQTTSLDNAEIVNYKSDNDELPNISFDDIDFSDIFADPENCDNSNNDNLNKEALFNQGRQDEDFDVAVDERFSPDEDEIDLEESVYNAKIVKEEKEEASKDTSSSMKIDDSDKVEDWSTESEGDTEGLDDMPSEVDSVITSIINRISGVMKSCFELDKPYGVISKNGLISYHKDKVKGTLVIDSDQPQNGNSEMEILYKTITESAGVNIVPASNAKFVPNYRNITGKSSKSGTSLFNYYPGQMLKYALGFVDGNKHTTWGAFERAIRKSIKSRLNEFYKKEDGEGNNEYYKYRDKIVEIYTNCLLILSYSSGGITVRASLIGMKSNIEANIKNRLSMIPIMSNSSVTVYPVEGYKDVVDIQIISDLKTVLGKPSWAYKALKVKLDNNEAPSLFSGLPIGRKLNGEIVEHKLDPSSGFLMFMAAGSGSGKGVMTLSLTAAAIGSGIPLFYTDYKPDMAPIFWEMSDKLNTQIYAFDANVKHHKNNENSGYELGSTLPSYVSKNLKEYAGAFLYLRSIALMCAMADYRAQYSPSDNGIFFVFDEIQAMQRLIYNAISKVQELYEESKPDEKKGGGDSEVYEYCKRVLNWAVSVDAAIDKYTVTTGRAGAVFSLFIGQNATAGLWNSIIPTVKIGKKSRQLPFMSRLLTCGTVVKFMGKGTSSSNYGLGGANITKEELNYISEYRFFSKYLGPDASKAEVTVFKPFLTLNYDDIFAKCWINGVGKTYGYQSPGKNATREQMVAANQKYIHNMQEAFPGEQGYSNEYGIHPGVGLLGLASMYCNGDIKKLSQNLGKSMATVIEYFNLSNLIAKYSSAEEYLYDMSESAWISQEDMVKYDPLRPEYSDSTDNNGEMSSDTGIIFDQTNKEDLDASDDIASKSDDADYTFFKESRKEIYNNEEADEQVFNNDPDEGYGQNERYGQNEGYGQSEGYDKSEGYGQSEGYDQSEGYRKTVEYSKDINKIINNANSIDSEIPDGYSKAPNGEFVANRPIEAPFSSNQVFQTGGSGGGAIFITPEKTAKILGLTKENSLVATMNEYETAQKFRGRLFKSLWGTKYVFKSRWKAILDCVTNNLNPDIIKRAIITEDAIAFNKMQIATVDIIGGDYDIRVEDIVDFAMTASRFKNIAELIIDTTILEAAQVEFTDVIDGMFKTFKSLNKFAVLASGYGKVTSYMTRAEYNEKKVNERMQEAVNTASFKSQMEAVAAAKNPRLKSKSPGYQNRVYESCMRFQGDGWRSAKDALLSKNPKLFKATGMTLLTTGVLAVGLVAGLVGKTIGLFKK